MLRRGGIRSLLTQLRSLTSSIATREGRRLVYAASGLSFSDPSRRAVRQTGSEAFIRFGNRSAENRDFRTGIPGIRSFSDASRDKQNEEASDDQKQEEETRETEIDAENSKNDTLGVADASIRSSVDHEDEGTVSEQDASEMESLLGWSASSGSTTASETVMTDRSSESDSDFASIDSESGQTDQAPPEEETVVSTVKLDSEGTKDLEEEDSVYQYSAEKRIPEDFVDFAKFEKWSEYQDAFKRLGDAARFRHVAAAFGCLRRLMPRPPDSFLQSISKIAVKHMDESRSNQLARLFYCCGKLRFIDEDLFEAMALKILKSRHAVEMDGCDLSITVYSIAILSRFQLLVFAAERGMRVVDLYQLHANNPPPVLFPSQPALIQDLSGQMTVPNRLAGFKEQELSSVAYGCGLLRNKDVLLLRLLAKEINYKQRLMHFSAQEISNIVYGFGLLDFKHNAMLLGISNVLLQGRRLMEFETQHLANTLYGCSRMGFVHPPLLEALSKEIQSPERLKRFREQELANIVSCAALIGIRDATLYQTLGREIIRSERLPLYMEHNFSTIILGLATVGVRDVDVLTALAKEMQRPERLPNYTSKDICDVITGFNNLEFLDDGFMLSLVAELRKPQRITQADTLVWQSCRAHVFSWSLAFPF